MVLISLWILLRLVLQIVIAIWLSDFDCPESFQIRLLGVSWHLELIMDLIRIGVIWIQLLESFFRRRAKNWLIEVFGSQSFPRLSNFDHAQIVDQLLGGGTAWSWELELGLTLSLVHQSVDGDLLEIWFKALVLLIGWTCTRESCVGSGYKRSEFLTLLILQKTTSSIRVIASGTFLISKMEALSQWWNVFRLSELFQLSLELHHELCDWHMLQISSGFEACQKLDYLGVGIFFALDVLVFLGL